MDRARTDSTLATGGLASAATAVAELTFHAEATSAWSGQDYDPPSPAAGPDPPPPLPNAGTFDRPSRRHKQRPAKLTKAAKRAERLRVKQFKTFLRRQGKRVYGTPKPKGPKP